MLNTVDRVLVLGVNPGHAGRKYQPYVDKKIERLLELKRVHDFEIYMDGAVTIDRINQWECRGVKGFILGTATLFKNDYNYKLNLANIKNNSLLNVKH